MSKVKLKNLLSLIFNIAIVVFTIIAFIMLYQLIQTQVFRYFTVLSNIFCGLVALSSIPFNILSIITNKEKRTVVNQILEHAATTVVSITFLTVMFFLGPTQGWTTMFESGSLYMHLITPVTAIIALPLFNNIHKLKWWTILIPIGLVIVYGTVYTTNVLFTKVWNDFYGFSSNIVISIIAMLLATVSISAGLYFLNQLFHKLFTKNDK